LELSLGVTLAVLAAGLMHATWNALLKSSDGGDPLLDTATIVAGSTVFAVAALPFVPLPALAAWPFAAASMVFHFGYNLTLAQAYRTGDLSFAYPLMRGTAPLIVVLLGALFLRELPPPLAIAGIVLICTGIVGIAFATRHRHPPAAVGWALANAVIIAFYTLLDGAGARASGHAVSYVLWMTLADGVVFLGWLYWSRRRAAVNYVATRWRRGLLGGFFSVAAYAIVLWAMTRAPVATVAALRETSVVFAAIIGAVVLKEGMGYARIIGALLVLAGVAALKF